MGKKGELASFEVQRNIRNGRPHKDPEMVPDVGFTKQLKAYDRELEVVWNWVKGKWEIWRFPESGKPPFHCLTVETENRTYRELSSSIIIELQRTDPNRVSLDSLCAYFDELDNQIQRRKRQDLKNRIESITLDYQQYARGVLAVQVPRWYLKEAQQIRTQPAEDLYINIPKEHKVRRAIANA